MKQHIIKTTDSNQPIPLWCNVCQKTKTSHYYYKNTPIHEREDIEPGFIYVLKEDYMIPKPNWAKWNKKKLKTKKP